MSSLKATLEAKLRAYWTCQNCDWTSESPNLNGPIMHETSNPDHKTEPTFRAAKAWSALGTGKITEERQH